MLSAPATPSSVDGCDFPPSAINTASLQGNENITKKKKKKRSREDEEAGSAATESLGESKKKRKHDNTPQEPAVEELTQEIDAPESAQKPKKKKKDKQKQTPLSEQTDAEIEANSQASAAALLSAIVAASVTNAEVPQLPSPAVYDPRLLPPPQNQFVQYPGMQYGYGLPPATFDPSGSQHPSVFSAPGVGGGGAFSELAFGSNDDLLRALQDLDMSKIANVLKSLGDASANQSTFTPQLGFMPSQLLQPPQASMSQVATTSHAILGVPMKQTLMSASHKRTINMSLPGNEQHMNPDHAYILANKWLNAGKLAELVRDEGDTRQFLTRKHLSQPEIQVSCIRRENSLLLKSSN